MFPTTDCSWEISSFLVLLALLTAISYKIIFSSSKIFYLVYILFTYTVFRGFKALFHFQFGLNIKSAIFVFVTLSIVSILSCSYLNNKQKFTLLYEKLILFFVPFGLISIYNLSTNFIKLQKKIILKSYQPIVKNQPRIFWLIFDELDQYLVFENGAKYQFNNLNLFKNESIYATRALQPGHCTNISLPAFTTGFSISSVTLNGPFNLKLNLSNKKSYDWKNSSNIFQKAFKLGYNSALIGWYHPYDRIFGKDLAYLSLESSYTNRVNFNRFNKFFVTLINQIFSFCNYNFDKLFQVFLKRSFIPRELIQTYEETRNDHWYNSLLESMENIIKNDQLNFCFFHLPIPHYPTCYDKNTDSIKIKAPNYYENVFLVDKTFDWFKRKLQEKQIWDNSIIILTSDHWLRTEKGFIDQFLEQENPEFKKLIKKRKAPYVPFIIKMPHQRKMKQINAEFNSLILHDIVVDIMSEKITDSNDVINKINAFSES
jgi:Sulfatase